MISLRLLGLFALITAQAQAPHAAAIIIPAAIYEFRNGDELRTVQVARFLIDEYEVTWADFHKFMIATAYKPSAMRNKESDVFVRVNSKGPRFPVGFVSQEDAIAFCGWKHERLPTPEEWQLAALGTEPRQWPWGVWDPKAANVNTHAMAEVGRFPRDKSPFGVFDMGGNMLEWTIAGSMGGTYVSDWQNPTTLIKNLDDWVENTGFRCAANAAP